MKEGDARQVRLRHELAEMRNQCRTNGSATSMFSLTLHWEDAQERVTTWRCKDVSQTDRRRVCQAEMNLAHLTMERVDAIELMSHVSHRQAFGLSTHMHAACTACPLHLEHFFFFSHASNATIADIVDCNALSISWMMHPNPNLAFFCRTEHAAFLFSSI